MRPGVAYDRPDLWPETTPFFDALVASDAPGGDLWSGYDLRKDTPFFSLDGGATVLSADWISDVWEKHVGCGAHIVRTLWHELACDADRDLTWMSLALCGQIAERTAQEYRVDNSRRRAAASGRRMMRAARQRL
jgi:hypothetical protein